MEQTNKTLAGNNKTESVHVLTKTIKLTKLTAKLTVKTKLVLGALGERVTLAESSVSHNGGSAAFIVARKPSGELPGGFCLSNLMARANKKLAAESKTGTTPMPYTLYGNRSL